MRQKRFDGEPDIDKIRDFAIQIRRDSIRMVHLAGAGHIGGSLGLADFMAVLYGYAMEFDSGNIAHPDRDRLVLSNGHTCPPWYAALARTGFIPPEELGTFRRLGSRLQGHPARISLPDLVETSSGPLGQGFSVANGIALSCRLRRSSSRVYCIIGDGEAQEGQVWEAAMTAAHYRLGNLVLFVNDNGLQIDGATSEVMNVEPLDGRFAAFGWDTRIIDGHDVPAIVDALASVDPDGGKPTAIVGKTLMGKGVSCMEDKVEWHGRWPDEQQTAEALDDVGTAREFEDFPVAEALYAG